MNKSTIEDGQPEQVLNNDSKADNQQVSPSIANAPVGRSVWDKFDEDYDEYSEPEICPLCGFNEGEDEEHDLNCENNDSPFSLLFREGFD